MALFYLLCSPMLTFGFFIKMSKRRLKKSFCNDVTLSYEYINSGRR